MTHTLKLMFFARQIKKALKKSFEDFIFEKNFGSNGF